LVDELNARYAKVQTLIDEQSDLKLETGVQSDLLALKELIRYLEQKHHTPAAIRRAHMFERMFVETNTATLERGLELFGGR